MFYCNLQPFQVHLKEKPSFFELDDINGTQILLRLCVDRWQNVRTNRVPYTQHDFYDWICKREKNLQNYLFKKSSFFKGFKEGGETCRPLMEPVHVSTFWINHGALKQCDQIWQNFATLVKF